jgi:hypothetical protein
MGSLETAGIFTLGVGGMEIPAAVPRGRERPAVTGLPAGRDRIVVIKTT